jgi:hypothetical protein
LSINQREVGQFLIGLPKEKERSDIIDLIRTQRDYERSVHGELDAANRLKAALLQNLLTGKVRVKMET